MKHKEVPALYTNKGRNKQTLKAGICIIIKTWNNTSCGGASRSDSTTSKTIQHFSNSLARLHSNEITKWLNSFCKVICQFLSSWLPLWFCL